MREWFLCARLLNMVLLLCRSYIHDSEDLTVHLQSLNFVIDISPVSSSRLL